MTTEPARTRHTPGPWTLAVNDRMVLARAFDGSEKAIIDRVRGGTPEQANANALLIAAAPELLEACKRLLKFNEELCVDVKVSTHYPSAEFARAAIAHAEGRS